MLTALLLLSLGFPLLGMALHAFANNAQGRDQARFALWFQSLYGGILILTGLLGFGQGGRTLWVMGPTFPVAGTGVELTPTLYLDARNAPLLLLLGMCLPLTFFWLRDRIPAHASSFHIAANLLGLSLCGVFISDSLLMFYLFWELALVGAYFWIGMHGKSDIHTGPVYRVLVRFVLFTLLGSLPMLLSIVALCASAGRDPGLGGLMMLLPELPESRRWWIFGGFALAFAVKMPLPGFHGWLRDTYNVAHPACRIVLSATMSKMGAYGFILVLAQGFPEECRIMAPYLQALCAAGALYGGVLCLAGQRFIDVLIYSSLAHLSLIGLGIFSGVSGGNIDSTALAAAIFQIFNHGLIMTALFAFEARITVSGESLGLASGGGLRQGQGRLSALLLLSIFAAASLPGLSNFAGEILVYFAAFQYSPFLPFVGALGALATAAALVRVFHQLFLGQAGPISASNTSHAGLKIRQDRDFNFAETGAGLALAAVWLVLGLYPMLFLRPVESALGVVSSSLVGTGILP